MKRALLATVLLMLAGQVLAADQRAQVSGMRVFASQAELIAFIKNQGAAARGQQFAQPLPPPPAAKGDSTVMELTVTAMKAAPSVITNNQEAGVDEGDIVKAQGDYLVVLRRGRLFTLDVAHGGGRPIDSIDAFPPGADGRGAWYDEMLISGRQVVVVGYSYARGGTELNRFHLAADGRLTFIDCHHLRSNDYYSSRNYASRLIGSKLIFYAPLEFDAAADGLDFLPALQRWTANGRNRFEPIIAAPRIYAPKPLLKGADNDVTTLHSVIVCEIGKPQLTCQATGVFGTRSRNFYVSREAIYVWTSGALLHPGAADTALLYRLPLDGGRPSAVQAWGGPVDQFSFREDEKKRLLNVVVRAEGGGERMWRAEISEGEPALLSLSLAAFGDGARAAPRRAYRPLPLASGGNWSFHNRFVGGYLVYAAGTYAESESQETVYVAPTQGGDIAHFTVPHGVSRIEIMGSDAVVIGGDNQDRLGFTAIDLSAPRATRGETYLMPAAQEGERRSHAFFYQPAESAGSGVLGLPVRKELPENLEDSFLDSSTSIAFLERRRGQFHFSGELEAHPATAADDACQASCVDWYGDARPIFLGKRVFALMGYELVEGRFAGGAIREVSRVNFAPAPVAQTPKS